MTSPRIVTSGIVVAYSNIPRRTVNLPEGEYKLPMLLPPLHKVKALEAHLRTLKAKQTVDGWGYSLRSWLELALSIPEFVEALDLLSGCIDIKFGGDGFRLTRASGQVNFYFTLLNLGRLIHSPEYVFTLLSWRGKENRESFEDNTELFIKEIEELISTGIDVDVV